MFRFSIRELMLVAVVVAMGLGWWLDHRAIHEKYAQCVDHLSTMRFTLWEARDSIGSLQSVDGSMRDGLYFLPQWDAAMHPRNRETLFPVQSLSKNELAEIARYEKKYPPSQDRR